MDAWFGKDKQTGPNMSLIGHLLPPLSSTSKPSSAIKTSLCLQIPESTFQIPNPKPILLSKLLSLALAATLSSPLPSLAIPSLNSQSSLLSPTTPFSQSKNLQTGLENGYVLNSFFVNGFCALFCFFGICNQMCPTFMVHAQSEHDIECLLRPMLVHSLATCLNLHFITALHIYVPNVLMG